MTNEVETVNGGCFCGNITFEFPQANFRVANCHCQMCRKTSGAPFVTWLVVPKCTFNYTKGQPKILQSSTHGSRAFCADCGTPMVFYTTTRPDDYDVTVGSLTHPEQFIPNFAVNEASKLPWLPQTEVNQKNN